MLPIFLPLALSTFLILGDTSAVRRGPDLLYQWSGLMKNVGSVEIYGSVSGQGVKTVVKGRFGGGALSLELGSDSQTWTTRVRTDGNEAEIEDIALGMILRRKISELKISIAEEGDIFGILPPLRKPVFLGEDAGGIQRWEYAVKTGEIYRVWLSKEPLRMLRRDVIGRNGRYRTTFIYSDHYKPVQNFALPKGILVENSDGEKMLELNIITLSLAPPLLPLPVINARTRNIYRRAEKISADPNYLRIVRDMHKLSNDSNNAVNLLASLNSIEDSYGVHPLIDSLRAKIGLVIKDDTLAGISVRAAASLGSNISVLTAQVGALEYENRFDSELLAKTFENSLPPTQNGLTGREENILADVTEIAYSAFLRNGDAESAKNILEKAWRMNPANIRIASMLVSFRIANGDETGALSICSSLCKERPQDIITLLQVGRLYEDLSRFDSAETFYRRIEVMFPDEPIIKLRLGKLLISINRYEDAEDVFDGLTDWMELADISADRRADISNEIAFALSDAGFALTKARRLIDYALAVNPEDPYYLDTLGLIYFKSGNRISATMAFEKALRLLENPGIREHLERVRR